MLLNFFTRFEFLKYILVGIFNTFYSYIVYLLLLNFFEYFFSLILTFIISLFVNFIIYGIMVFNQILSLKKFFNFTLFSLIYVLINIFITTFLIEFIYLEIKLAPLITIFFLTPFAFYIKKKIFNLN